MRYLAFLGVLLPVFVLQLGSPAAAPVDQKALEVKILREVEALVRERLLQEAEAVERSRLLCRTFLEREITHLDAVCKLSAEEKARLKTAVKGAVKRYEASLKKPYVKLSDNEGFGVYLRGKRRLLESSPHEQFVLSEPLWEKAVRSTLGEERMEFLEESRKLRRDYRQRSRIMAVVARLDGRLRFSAEQRTKMERVVKDELLEEVRDTDGDNAVLPYLEYRVLNLFPEKLEPFLSPEQCEEIQAMIIARWWDGDVNTRRGGGGLVGGGGGLF